MDTKNVQLTEEEKMRKRFGLFRKITSWLIGLLCSIPILFLLLGGIIFLTGTEEITEEVPEIISEENQDTSISENNENQEDSQIVQTIYTIAGIINYILIIFLLDCLKKVFGEIEQKGTPFTEYNVKNLNRIRNLTILSCILERGGLIFVLIVISILYVFKYGYKLQNQADETL